jgi:hypothetical protein
MLVEQAAESLPALARSAPDTVRQAGGIAQALSRPAARWASRTAGNFCYARRPGDRGLAKSSLVFAHVLWWRFQPDSSAFAGRTRSQNSSQAKLAQQWAPYERISAQLKRGGRRRRR